MTKVVRLRLVLWVLATVAAVVAVYLVTRPPLVSGSLPGMEISGVAQVGGPFDLTDQSGNRIKDKDLLRNGGVITFGWTGDPDLTPALLQVLSAALSLNTFGDRKPAAVFVTLDPERDRPERLSDYLKAFHPTLVGLTGSPTEINNLASAYKLYWKRIADGALPGGYSIDFAALYYVMGPGGVFLGVVPYTTEVVELAKEIGILLKR